jgi:hypothetical protein
MVMAIAPQRSEIGIRRHFTTEGVHPYDEVTWERRDARITNYRDGTGGLRAARRRGARVLERERHQHPGPEVLPGDPRHPRARVVAAQVADRVVDTITAWGSRTATSSTTRRPRLQPRAQVPDHPPEGRVQLAGVVQHRRARACRSRARPASSSRGGLDGLHPQLVHRGRDHLQGRLGRRASTCRRSARRTSC